MAVEPIVVPPGEGHRVGNVELHGFRNDGAEPLKMLNIHAPAGFDRRIGVVD